MHGYYLAYQIEVQVSHLLDADIEASAEAFIADKVSQAWEIHHKR